MKKLYYIVYFLMSAYSGFSQGTAWADKAICATGGSAEIGDDGDPKLCYTWKATPADPNVVNLKSPKISVSPTQNTTYTRTAIGQDFSTINTEDVKVLIVNDVVFSEAITQKYGYDDHTNPSIPWKSVENGKFDPIRVSITPAAGYKGVYFKVNSFPFFQNVEVAPKHAPSDQFDINIFGTSKGEDEVDANCEKEDGNKIKEFNAVSYNLKIRTVAVRLVNETNYSSTDVSDAAIISNLNDKYYNQAVVKWIVHRLPPVTVNFDINHDGKLDVSAWMTNEMKIIRDNSKDDTYDYNIFLVNNPSVTGRAGSMNFNQRYGFVHVDNSLNPPNTIAHELGHGNGLMHTLPDVENVMYNYESLNRLKFRKDQWDNLH